ncbi:gelsolin-related protein [Dictyostelium discoideum AX4]|uniref:Gelsolin-related protein n=1 Tax=Dictyostelium discoideum TaxID=44689 RepID=Q54EF8_DICDI|nr:gelsolin-related protein [Dictyostelium discoideum AX4]EAL61752.1 gelsolin-related protein [Dictyostelium discoideum AX4]|eukprot:XP_635282.1 gelsolin-related protein [Dictyostelium discoideum AX4]
MEPKKNTKGKKPPTGQKQHQNRKANRDNQKKKQQQQQQQQNTASGNKPPKSPTSTSPSPTSSASPSPTPSASPSPTSSASSSSTTSPISNNTKPQTPIISPTIISSSSSSSPPKSNVPPSVDISNQPPPSSSNTTTTTNNNINIEENTELSNIEKENLNKTILDIKKKDHAHKKEKQKKLEERKKLLNESIQKKHEQQKQLKKEEEERKKQMEKERIESEKEINDKLNELAKTNPSFAASNTLGRKMGLHSLSTSNLNKFHNNSTGTISSSSGAKFFNNNNNSSSSSGNSSHSNIVSSNNSNHIGTVSRKGFSSVSDEKLTEALKKKHQQQHQQQQQNGSIGSSSSGSLSNSGSGFETSLRKYSSHNSIGIKSGALFRTISIPRLSKQQISVVDLFNSNNGNNSNNSNNNNNISPNTSTSNLSTSLQNTSSGASLTSIFNPPSSSLPPQPQPPSSSLPSTNNLLQQQQQLSSTSLNQSQTSQQSSTTAQSPPSFGFGSFSKRGSMNLGQSNSTMSSSHMNEKGEFTFKNFIPNSQRKNHLLTDKNSQRLSKDDFFSSQNTHRRWEEYVKNILPTEQELIKEKKELERQRELKEQELVKQQLLLLQQKDQEKTDDEIEEELTSDDDDDDDDDDETEEIEEEEIEVEVENEKKLESPIVQSVKNGVPTILGSPKKQHLLDSPKKDSPRKSQHLDSPRKLQLQQQQQEQQELSEKDIEMLSPLKKIEKQEKNDGDRFIKALLNKTPIATKTAYSMNVNGQTSDTLHSSNKSEKPVEMVNIFKYGSIDIDFTEIFGEVEDLQGFIMWKVNGFSVEERDFEDYCTLYSKDAYLVFNVTDDPKDSVNSMYNIHLWYGKDSGIDKRCTAVMMAIQLLTHLGGKCNQFVEEQSNESSMFLNYFINHQESMFGVKHKNGGSECDFFSSKSYLQQYQRKSRLYKIDIPPVELESCASISIRRMGLSRKVIQDSSNEISWLLVNPQNIYMKFGSKSSFENKILTREISKQFENHYSNTVKISQINDEKEFCKLVKQFKTKEDRDKDFKYSEDDETIVNLYRTILKANGKLGLEQIAEEYPLHYSLLGDCLDQVYILDCTTDIFIWCPKGVGKKKVLAAKECAKVFFKEYERPEWAEIIVLQQHNESPLFKRQFKDWPIDRLTLANCVDQFKLAEIRSNISSDKLYYDFHYINFTCRDEVILPLYENLPTDKVDVYGVTLPDLQFFRLEPEDKCHFYEDDCFMIMVSSRKEASPYAVNQNDITQTVIYWWEGVTADNRGYAMFYHGLYPIIANKFEDKGQAKPSVYLATQRKEPTHFLKAFDETLIIHKGSRFDEPEISHKVYQFINEGPNTYIQQLDQNSVVLNSYNVYFIRSAIEGTITIWKGANTFTPMEELETFAQRLDEQFKLVFYEQGSEPNHFWDMLPGVKNSIPMDLDLSNDSLFKFYLSPESQVKMTRINRKYSSDLKSTECCLLDSPDVLYVWVGSNCSASLENIVLIFVNDYCNYYSIPIDSIQKVVQYNESIEFKLRFKAWDRKEEWVDPHETRQCQVALQRTLLFRKQYEEEQQLFKEYMDYAYSLGDEDELEDFETWTLIKKGYLDYHGELNLSYSDQLNGTLSRSLSNSSNGSSNSSTSPNLNAHISSSPSLSNGNLYNYTNGNGGSTKPPLSKDSPSSPPTLSQQQHTKNNGLPPLPKSSKKKKFFGLFKK